MNNYTDGKDVRKYASSHVVICTRGLIKVNVNALKTEKNSKSPTSIALHIDKK